MRVLIVEDDHDIRENLARYLRGKGYAVDTAADGLIGLHRACDFQIDIAVIDCGLPDLTGIDLVTKIRSLNLQYPILVMTSYDNWGERTGFIEAGADGYIEKAFRPQLMLDKIEALLRNFGLMNPLPHNGLGKLKSGRKSVAVDFDVASLSGEARNPPS